MCKSLTGKYTWCLGSKTKMTNTFLCIVLLRFSSLVFPYSKMKLFQEPLCYRIETSSSPRLPLGKSQNSYAVLKTQLWCLWASHGEWCHTEWPSFFQFRKRELYCFYTLAAAENPQEKGLLRVTVSQIYIQLWMWAHLSSRISTSFLHIRVLLTEHMVLGMNNSIPCASVQYLQLKINQVLLSLETNQVSPKI